MRRRRMSSDNAKIQPLKFPAPDAEPDNVPAHDRTIVTDEPAVCSYCYGTGMEVVAGKGARRCLCRTQNNQVKLLEAARIPRRYEKCSLDTFECEPNTPQSSAYRSARRLVLDWTP